MKEQWILKNTKIKNVYKIFIALVLVFGLAISSFAEEIDIIKIDEEIIDDPDLIIDLEKQPKNLLSSELLVMGDSFSVLEYMYSNYKFNIMAHHGYTLDRIYNEFLPCLKKDQFKYVFLFVGPNDFMCQTDIIAFEDVAIAIAQKFQDLNIIPIITNYYDPRYDMDPRYRTLDVKCNIYAEIFYDAILNHGGHLFDSSDIYVQYGNFERDVVHPSITMYRPMMDRLLQYILESEATHAF